MVCGTKALSVFGHKNKRQALSAGQGAELFEESSRNLAELRDMLEQLSPFAAKGDDEPLTPAAQPGNAAPRAGIRRVRAAPSRIEPRRSNRAMNPMAALGGALALATAILVLLRQ